MDLPAVPGAVQHLLGDADLLGVLLAGIAVVRVHEHGRIHQSAPLIQLVQTGQVLIVIIGMRDPVRIHIAAEDGVCEGISLALHLPVAVDEHVRALGRPQRIHHHGQVAARRILHAHGDIQAARRHAMLLVLHRTGTHGHVREHVVQEAVMLRVEHLVRAGETGLVDGAHVQFADGNQAPEHVGLGLGIRLVQHTLVAGAGGARLVGIDARHDQDLVRHPLLQGAQAGNILDYRILPVGRAGPDHDQQPVALPGEHGTDAFVIAALGGCTLRRDRIHLLDLLGDRQLALENHIHSQLLFVKERTPVRGQAHHLLHCFFVPRLQRIAQLHELFEEEVHL